MKFNEFVDEKIAIFIKNDHFYRASLHMIAIIFITGSIYACNERKPNMDAISVSKGTKYACNLKSTIDYLCLQSFSNWTRYTCNHRKFLYGHVTTRPFSTVQAYFFPF